MTFPCFVRRKKEHDERESTRRGKNPVVLCDLWIGWWWMTIAGWSNVDGVRTCVCTQAGTSAVGGSEDKDENGGNVRTTARTGGSGDNT